MARSGRCASGDLLHCPAGTEHIFVGAGDRPCAVLMIGSRREDGCHYAVNDTAAKYGASVTQETDDPAAAYADWRAEGPGSPSHEPMAARVTRTETKRDEATMKASEVLGAVAAGMSTASALDLTVDDAVVLHDSNRLAVRLLPCDVLARVAHVAHQAGAEFEVEVARRLAETDSPVAKLEPRVEPRVYVRDGFVVTLWTYYEPVPSRDVAPPEYAQALERLHAGMRQIDVTAPHFTDRVAEAQWLVGNRAETPELADADRDLLTNTLRSLRRVIDDRGADEQLLHGEPHPANLLTTKKGLLFVDLETCCRGPVEFDIAHAPAEVSEHYPAANQDLLRECRILMLAMIATWRWDRDDQLPNGRQLGTEGLSQIRAALDRYGLDTRR